MAWNGYLEGVSKIKESPILGASEEGMFGREDHRVPHIGDLEKLNIYCGAYRNTLLFKM